MATFEDAGKICKANFDHTHGCQKCPLFRPCMERGKTREEWGNGLLAATEKNIAEKGGTNNDAGNL